MLSHIKDLLGKRDDKDIKNINFMDDFDLKSIRIENRDIWYVSYFKIYYKNVDKNIKRVRFEDCYEFIEDGEHSIRTYNGTTIKGHMKNGLPHGCCKIKIGESIVIKGDFIKGELHGKCKIMIKECNDIIGNFKYGMPHGVCEIKLNDGNSVKCDFTYSNANGVLEFGDKNYIKFYNIKNNKIIL